MRPGVGELRSEAVPLANFQNGLEGVVVGVSVAFDLVDDAEVRELREIGAAGLLRGSCCIELKNSADDMVGPSLIGWVEVSGFSRRFKGSERRP